MDTVDITNLQLHGKELTDQIHQAVKDTQRYIIRPLPNKLVMRPDQFDELQHDPDMLGDYEPENHVFLTPMNAMDVVIKIVS